MINLLLNFQDKLFSDEEDFGIYHSSIFTSENRNTQLPTQWPAVQLPMVKKNTWASAKLEYPRK